MPDKLPADLIAPKALARILAVHLSTVHRWIHAGRLRAWRRGGSRYLVSEAEGRAMLVPVAVVAVEKPRTPQDQAEAAEAALVRLREKGYKC